MAQSVLNGLVLKAAIWTSTTNTVSDKPNKRRNSERRDSFLPEAFRRPSNGDPFKREFDTSTRRISYAFTNGGPMVCDVDEEREKTESNEARTVREERRNSISNDEAVNSVLKVWQELCRESTCHGLKNIESRQRTRLYRIIWTLIVIAMSLGLFYSVVQLIYQYNEFHTVTRTDVSVSTKRPFPSITLCNSCPYRRAMDENDPILFEMVAQTTIFKDFFPLNTSSPGLQRVYNMSSVYFQEKYAYKIHELILSAKYEGQLLNLWEDFEITTTRFGRCFTFNGPKYIKKHGIRMLNYDGRNSGLQVLAKINQDRYYVYEDLTAGIRMYISHHPETSRLEKDGIDLHPGTSSKIALSPTEYQFLPDPYVSYGTEACVESEKLDVRLNNSDYPFYSYNICMELCLHTMASYNCSCYDSILYIQGLQPCTIGQEMKCMAPFKSMYNQGLSNLGCDCPRPCTFTRYDPVMSASQLPSRASSRLVMQLLNESNMEFIRENYLEFRVYLGTMVVRRELHEPKFTFNSMFAYLGGQMGFFMGASLMTLTEFAEAIGRSIVLCFRKKIMKIGQLERRKSCSRSNQNP